jgi:hypothetical protein
MTTCSSPNRVRARAARILAAALVAALAACGHTPAGEGPPAAPGGQRVGLDEATALVRAEIFERKPTMNESMEAPLRELTTDEIWRRLGVQLYQVTEGVRACATYLVLDGRAHLLCGGFGGNGIQSACVTDLDGDGAPELTYTWSWGSGIHRSQLGVCRVTGDGLLQEVAPLAYVGDLFVRKESDERVVVEIGDYGWELGAWTPEARLGVVEVEPDGRLLHPRIELAALSEEHAEALWPREPVEGEGDG